MFEKVNPMHPDKIADRIAGALVDLAYNREENPKVAVEVLIGHGYAYIIAESSVKFTHEDVEPIVTRIVGKPLTVRLLSIPQDKHLAENQQGNVKCGDNGIFKGTPMTYEQRLLTSIASDIYDTYKTDGKYIITGNGRPWNLTICQSHVLGCDEYSLCKDIEYQYAPQGEFDIKINPLGEWTGGPDVDCGATNRKLGSDMGDGVTGGGLHGKDLSKADVSVNIWCYLEANKRQKTITASCSIGDSVVNGLPYDEIVAMAKEYIESIGGFEKFSEWGLIRP